MSDDQEIEYKFKLPEGFLLGVSAAAHQVEGNNKNNDWWQAETQGKVPASGLACDHYNRFEEDFSIAKQIGCNAFRISIEWSRIEPEEGKWAVKELEHYHRVLLKMKELGLQRFVTLFHFTLPKWLAAKGGFEHPDASQAFARFAWFVAKNLGQEIDWWMTINEPEVYVSSGYVLGKWPPFKKSKYFTWIKVYNNLIDAHRLAYRAIKLVLPQARVGLAKNNVYYEPGRQKNILDKMAAKVADYFGNYYLLDKISSSLDFIGLNYYFYERLSVDWKKFRLERLNQNFDYKHLGIIDNIQRSDMGWRTYPKGIYYLLKELKKYKKPVIITENGIANARDDMRKDFIKQHLYWTTKAIDEGVDVRGYLYWSLTDNYEWSDGYGPRFGLVEINYDTQRRVIRESANVFQEVINSS